MSRPKKHKTEHKTESKSETKPEPKILIVPVMQENYFVLHDGTVIKDYRELAANLATMSDDAFSYHVNNDKNDFATWIHDIFKEEELAADIRKCRSKVEMEALLYKWLFFRLEKLHA